MKLRDNIEAAARKLDGRMKFQGLDISIENGVGSVRQGVDKMTGKKWRTVMRVPYGYIRMSEGTDGDHVDCFIGPNKKAEYAYVVHQVNPATKQYDEDKVMLGFNSVADAKRVYLEHYDTPAYFGSIERIPMVRFIAKVLATRKSKVKKIKASIFAGGPGSGCHGPNCGRPSLGALDQAMDSVILKEKISDAKGSNPGGIYKGSDGVERYVKFYKTPKQGRCEAVANSIYRDLGLVAPKSLIFKTENQGEAHATEIIKGKSLGSEGLTQENCRQVLKGFAADVLLDNWDAVGLDHDNILITNNGLAARIDNGGSLLTRAQGKDKPESGLNTINEWTSLLNPTVNSAYASVAKKAGYTSAEDIPNIKERIQDIIGLRSESGGWDKYLQKKAPYLSNDERKKIGSMLEARTDQLVIKLAEMSKVKLPSQEQTTSTGKYKTPGADNSTLFKNGMFYEKVPATVSGSGKKEYHLYDNTGNFVKKYIGPAGKVAMKEYVGAQPYKGKSSPKLTAPTKSEPAFDVKYNVYVKAKSINEIKKVAQDVSGGNLETLFTPKIKYTASPMESWAVKVKGCGNSPDCLEKTAQTPKEKLYAKLGLSPKDGRNWEEMISDWVGSSNSKFRNLTNEVMNEKKLSSPIQKALATESAITQAYLRQTHPDGQIKLYRGIHGEYAKQLNELAHSEGGAKKVAKVNYADSWTDDPHVAKNFSGGAVLVKNVPISYVVSCYKTNGQFMSSEKEYIVAWPKGEVPLGSKHVKEPHQIKAAADFDLTSEENANWLGKKRDTYLKNRTKIKASIGSEAKKIFNKKVGKTKGLDALEQELEDIVQKASGNKVKTEDLDDFLEDRRGLLKNTFKKLDNPDTDKSDARVDFIDETETRSAREFGRLKGYQSLGDDEIYKQWVAMDPCSTCQDNEDAGPIPLDEPFPSGDMSPLAHPRCECELEYVDKDGNSVDDDIDEEDEEMMAAGLISIGDEVVVDGIQQRAVICKKLGRNIFVQYKGRGNQQQPYVHKTTIDKIHPLVGRLESVEAWNSGGIGIGHIDPGYTFHPPSLKNPMRIPTDDPMETDDRFLDVTQRTKRLKDRIALMKKGAPSHKPNATTTSVSHHMGVMPMMVGSIAFDDSEPAKYLKRTAKKYKEKRGRAFYKRFKHQSRHLIHATIDVRKIVKKPHIKRFPDRHKFWRKMYASGEVFGALLVRPLADGSFKLRDGYHRLDILESRGVKKVRVAWYAGHDLGRKK